MKKFMHPRPAKLTKLVCSQVQGMCIVFQTTTAYLLRIKTLFSAGLSHAQTPLQDQLNQQGVRNCPGTTVSIGISTGFGISQIFDHWFN